MVLKPFLKPKSIALFGSMSEERNFGAGIIVRDLLAWHYPGNIYPVHPTASSVYGLKVLRKIDEIPSIPELAVIITSFRQVLPIINECGKKGIKSVVVVSDGFGEAGPEGKERERELVKLAQSYGIRIMGPNTIGVFNAADRVTTVPYDRGYPYQKVGGLSIVTQTGMYGPQAMAWHEFPPGINKVIDLGNMCDVDETDCLSYLTADEGTKVISLYMEHTRRPRDFLAAAREATMKKPILCLKPGKSTAAARAMASHTGSLAGNDALYRTVLNQAGVVTVEDYEDLRYLATPFLTFTLPRGNRLGILTFSGAIGIQCIDLAHEMGIQIASLTPLSLQKLSSLHETLRNHPIDVGPASALVGTGIFALFKACYDILREDETVDVIYINTYVSPVVKPFYYEEILEYMAAFREKPTVLWCYGPAGELVQEFGYLAGKYGLPFFSTTRKALLALSTMIKYARYRQGK